MILVYTSLLLALTKGTVELQISAPEHSDNDFDILIPTKPTLFYGRTQREISTTRDDDGGHHPTAMLTVPIDSEELVLDLKLNEELLTEEHTLHYQEGGKTVAYKPKKEELNLCYYHGSVRGKSNSWVAVSTCHGINGAIFDGTTMWFIKSTEDTFGYKHFLYTSYQKTHSGYRREFNSSVQAGVTGKQKTTIKQSVTGRHKRDVPNFYQKVKNIINQQLYVELRIYADNDLYNKFGSVNAVHSNIIALINIVNSMYSPLNITISLMDIIVWNEKDEVTVNVNDMDYTHRQFFLWTLKLFGSNKPYDHVMLMSGQKYISTLGTNVLTLGTSAFRTMCDYESVTILNHYSQILGRVAATMAHEIGHSLGMNHDSVAACECPTDNCIMTDTYSMNQRLHWSSCSIEALVSMYNNSLLDCLRNKPARLFNSPTCGNGFVEPGEECDCELDFGGRYDPCFDCCDLSTCRFKAAGTVCRDAVSEYDQPEYCSGSSEYCPVNKFKETPFTIPVPDGMYPGRIIQIQASTTTEAQWFTINLQCGANINGKDDIAFHLSFRFNQSVVARTHRQRSNKGVNKWGREEKEGGIPIARGEPFEVMFLCEESAFKVFVNGTYFAEFKHRIPYRRITHLNFQQQIVVQSVSFKDAAEVTPFTIPIPDGMYPGRTIRVQASTSTEAQRFNINLQYGPRNYIKDSIALHLAFNFNHSVVVRNDLQISSGNSSWGSEELEGGIPFTRGEPFEVLLLCEETAFKIFINGSYFTEFKHRIPYQNITHLNFEEQISVRSVSFKDAAEVTPLTYPIPDGMYPGRTILVKASTSPEAQWFSINLQCGPSNGKDDIAFHLSFRFKQSLVARTHRLISANGTSTWGSEEKGGGIPIARGEPFELTFLCEEKGFKVLINGTLFTEFQHHIPYQRITHLSFKDQITVRSVGF